MRAIAYLILFLFITTSVCSSELNFTKEEKDWINRSSSIRLGADYKWPPFDFVDSSGTHSGLAAEYIKLISKKSGLKFDVTAGKWSNIIKDMKDKKFDGLACAVETDERKKYLMFTDAYLSVPMVIISQIKNLDIKDINDLEGKSVAVNKGSYVQEWLEKKYPKIKLYLTTSNEASIEAVSLGEADAYVGNLAVATYIMNKYLISNLKIINKLKDFKTSVSIAIDKDNFMLFNIMQKTLRSISPGEDQEIKSKWKKNLSIDKQDVLLNFSTKQKSWIKKHKVIKYVIDNEWRPIEYFSKKTNTHEGISRSYLDLVSQKTGINFELVRTNSWADSVETINNRKADLYTVVVKTDSREKVMDFSATYIKMPQVFVTNRDINFIADIRNLYGKKIVLIKGYALTEIIKKEHPQISVIEVGSIHEALDEIVKGNALAYIDILPMISYYIQQKGFSNLKVSGTTEYLLEFSMALRNDWEKEGLEIINKALKSITEEEKQNIYNKWLHVEYDKNVDYTLVWQIAGVLIFFIIATLYWNRKLAVEVEKRKLAQEELFALNQKLEKATDIAQSANRAKSDFLSNMSHEIRTPMNAILGFAELLDEKIEDKKLKSFIKTIRSSGETLLHLINDILDLSKIEAGKLELVKSTVNIKKMFEDTVNIFNLQAEKKALKLILNLDDKMPRALLLDFVRLQEILINLIGNAIKFTPKGQIKINVVVDEVYEHTSKIDLSVIIEDEGIGISQANQEKIFNIFEQSENQDIKKYGGTGLGLAISRKLANLMNGTLEVKSDVDVGSTFVLSLKNIDIASLSDEKIYDELHINYNAVEFEKSVILVVDDVKENRDLVKESFSQSNIKVLEAVNGQEAVDMVKNNEINLVLMDIRMPVMDGYTATNLIKEFSSIPIVALTASVMQEEMKNLEGKKFDGYLRKPISKNELFEEMAKYLKHSTVIVEEENIKKEEEIIVADIDEFKTFLDILETKINVNYEKALATNDIAIITSFAQSLFDTASQYDIKYVKNYANLLLEKIDMFEIDSINEMLNEYKKIIEKLEQINHN